MKRGPNGKGAIVVAENAESVCEFINWFAPEHLMVMCDGDMEKL